MLKESPYLIKKNNYTIEKGKKVEDLPKVENFNDTSFVSADTLLSMGVKPKYLSEMTQEKMDHGRQLIAGAEDLMRKRLNGLTDFPISRNQYDTFLNDAKEKSKLYAYGFITIDELGEWVFDQINVMPEKENTEEKLED